MNYRNITLGTVAALIALLAIGCGQQEQAQSVEERAVERWNALFDEDYEKAYSYLTPGYRSSVKLSGYIAFLARKRLGWVGARYQSHSCDEDVCTVLMEVDYKVSRPVPGMDVWESTATVTEIWRQVDGNWYLVPDS